jgi:hypothetical protein
MLWESPSAIAVGDLDLIDCAATSLLLMTQAQLFECEIQHRMADHSQTKQNVLTLTK